jgi:competence protein ComEA
MKTGTRRTGARALGLCLALAVALAAAPGFGAESPALSGTVNVNTASVEQLQLLPGIGESRARAVVEARKQRGGFKAVEDLLEVKGIGEASLERLKPYVTLEGKTTARKP